MKALDDSSSLWSDIMFVRYSVFSVSFRCIGRSLRNLSFSAWWRGVSLLGSKKEEPLNWFKPALSKKVRFNCLTSFWKDPWISSTPSWSNFRDFSSSPKFKMDLWVRYGCWIRDQSFRILNESELFLFTKNLWYLSFSQLFKRFTSLRRMVREGGDMLKMTYFLWHFLRNP